MTLYEVGISYRAYFNIEAESLEEAQDLAGEHFWSDGLKEAERDWEEIKEVEEFE